MLKKIFKTIFIMSLCVGISLPTNAAVSVSDGSAFVTKAEFAADLNNLSNRMAQLENSLDAKIDSLVSSYLTRNGIWNGAKQEVILSGSTYNYGSNTDNWLRWFGWTGSESISFSVMNTGSAASNILSHDYKVIDNINKSGMLVMVFNMSLRLPNGNPTIYSLIYSSKMTLQMGSWEKSLTTRLSWYIGKNNTPDRNRMIQSNQIFLFQFVSAGGATASVLDISGFPFQYTLLGFVSKGDQLFMTPEWWANGFGTVNVHIESNTNDQYKWQYYFNTDGAYVY